MSSTIEDRLRGAIGDRYVLGHLVMIGAPAGVEPDMVVVVNWFAELGKRTR